MKRTILFLVLAIAVSSRLFSGVVEKVEPQRGRPVAQINWSDETGRVRRLSEFAGFPMILLPIYTRCPGACIANVDQLKVALAECSVDPRQFRVLLFSFDASDTPAKLAAYRTRENIPLAWFVGTATQPNVDALLESAGFQYGRAGTEFAHANLLLFLDSNLRVAKWIYGTGYSGRDVERALNVASGESDWIGQHSEWLYSLLLFSASLLFVAFVYFLAQLMVLRRALRRAQMGSGVVAIDH